ncbi:hypothetical protein S40293_00027 [Stachybotrys chartarum IBT 40293]|nr:hypothetical protein S40293_00027 [Stachybotrys chartarum IBT 40293]
MTSFEPRLSAPEPRSKRIKIDVACNTCRARKVKCDGIRPACSNCSRKLQLRDSCTYSQVNHISANPTINVASPTQSRHVHGSANSPTPVPRSHLRPLHDHAPAGPWMNDPTDHAPVPVPIHHPSATESLADSRASDDVSASAMSRDQVNAVSPSVINSMTAVVDEGTTSREYFGSSSAGSFTAQIKKAIDARVGGGRSADARPNHVFTRQSTNAVAPGNQAFIEANRVLPTRRQADRLLSLYWTYVDPLYPFLDRPTWEQAYHGLFNGLTISVDEHLFIATMNIIFALCTQLQESMTWEEREASSSIFFGRAQQLLPLNTWDPGSIELVQYLLLASQYLQSTDEPHQTWMVVGAAIRIAQGLGLHLNETAVEHPEMGDPSLLRRVWYGCVLMDRMVSMTHGRPPMMSSQLASALPLPTLSPPVGKPTGPNTYAAETDPSFFVKSVELYEIIQSLYYGAGALAKSKQTTSEHGAHFEEEATDLCTNLVAALLEYQTADGSIGLLPAWWYRVYYVYTAATVLIAAKLRPDVFAGGCGQSARKCVAALFFLYSKILQDGSASGTASRAPAHNEDHPEQGSHDAGDNHQTESVNDFSFPLVDFDQQHLDEVEFDVNNLAWLNDMNAAWDLLHGG